MEIKELKFNLKDEKLKIDSLNRKFLDKQDEN